MNHMKAWSRSEPQIEGHFLAPGGASGRYMRFNGPTTDLVLRRVHGEGPTVDYMYVYCKRSTRFRKFCGYYNHRSADALLSLDTVAVAFVRTEVVSG